MADSPFPFIDGISEEATGTAIDQTAQADLPIWREYAWDFSTNDFVLVDGNPVRLEGLPALEIWMYKTMRTERFRYLAYSWEYGHELDSLLGQRSAPDKSEAERFIREALSSPYVLAFSDFEIEQSDDVLNLSFTAETVYGEVRIDGYRL
ncbi:DUF2634 domain-containing protein [Paenibacillus sp. RUD330]|uniref:DUF2634 domain-containing protein n=1 Tax=Paenibacillus sp. RUD330 TaxID=2023772 RepID=UPI000B927775|nr:DUF2634 domain-containing protein [Paenibacillus sp. RUD330]ASS64683.1 DUF2634 domain-containing protein [Paenibacillus sp. RUD330]